MPNKVSKESLPEISARLAALPNHSTSLKTSQKLHLLKKELLKKIDTFTTVPPDVLDILVKKSEDIFLLKDTVLFQEGDENGRSMYIILSGRTLVYKSKKNIAELGPGEIVGEMPVVDMQPRSASVKTLEDTLLLEISEEMFQKYIATNSSALLAMMSKSKSSKRIRNSISLLG